MGSATGWVERSPFCVPHGLGGETMFPGAWGVPVATYIHDAWLANLLGAMHQSPKQQRVAIVAAFALAVSVSFIAV